MDIGREIRLTRAALGLNQAQLAKLIWPEKDPKSAQSNISRYEKGRSIPPADIYLQILELVKK